MGNSATNLSPKQVNYNLYIALIGVNNSGKSHILDAYRSYKFHAENKAEITVDHPDIVHFQYRNVNICAYNINADPFNWNTSLESMANKGKLDCIAVVINSSNLETQVIKNEYSYIMILSHWKNKCFGNKYSSIPEEILTIICSYIEKPCSLGKWYMDFMLDHYCYKTENTRFSLQKYPLGIYALTKEIDWKNMAVTEVTVALKLHKLHMPLGWTIIGCEMNDVLIQSDPDTYKDMLRLDTKEVMKLIEWFYAKKKQVLIGCTNRLTE
eukprot:130861_1